MNNISSIRSSGTSHKINKWQNVRRPETPMTSIKDLLRISYRFDFILIIPSFVTEIEVKYLTLCSQ